MVFSALFHDCYEADLQTMFEHRVMRLLSVTGELFNCCILNQFLGTAQEGHESCSIHLNSVLPGNAAECVYLP